MKRLSFISLIIVFGLALALVGARTPDRVESASVQPSWEILEGEPNSCADTDGFSIQVYINNPAAASEQGQLTVPGYGQVGYTTDSNFSGIGTFSFFIFNTVDYSVPAHTPLTLTVTTYNLPNFAGGVSYVDTMTWDCTTGLEVAPAVKAGCDVLMNIPAGTVGGTFVANAQAYWAPGKLTAPVVTLAAGKSARVIGLDESGQYYKIIWGCNYLWVLKDTLGPNYDNVWHGAPLPTTVVK